MPISLRIPAGIETQIEGFSARRGLTKSAVIVRSMQEYLARHAQPSSFEIYADTPLLAPQNLRKGEAMGAHLRKSVAKARK